MDDIENSLERITPERLLETGFRWGNKGTHTSRTIMLHELTLLLNYCTRDATRKQYLKAIQDDNCLGKRTVATRRLSSQRLSELYALDQKVLLFRLMRRLWFSDTNARPILTILLALARDPLLRLTVNPILKMQPGEELSRQNLTDALWHSVGSRFNESTLDKIVRNTASSWTQSGHFKGRGRKIRQRIHPTHFAVVYAIFLGYALGNRGEGLFRTTWARVLDAQPDEITALALDAKRLGFLDMSQSGGIIEISFSKLLTEEERQLIHGTD